MHTRLLVAYWSECRTMYSTLYSLQMDTGAMAWEGNIYVLVS